MGSPETFGTCFLTAKKSRSPTTKGNIATFSKYGIAKGRRVLFLLSIVFKFQVVL